MTGAFKEFNEYTLGKFPSCINVLAKEGKKRRKERKRVGFPRGPRQHGSLVRDCFTAVPAREDLEEGGPTVRSLTDNESRKPRMSHGCTAYISWGSKNRRR